MIVKVVLINNDAIEIKKDTVINNKSINSFNEECIKTELLANENWISISNGSSSKLINKNSIMYIYFDNYNCANLFESMVEANK